MRVATRRGGIFAADAPEQLRRGIEDNLRTLDVDTLPVVNLRLMRAAGPDAFFDDQLAAMISARDDGLIASIGLSNITLEHLLYALHPHRRGVRAKRVPPLRTAARSPCSTSARGEGSRSYRSHRWASVSPGRTPCSTRAEVVAVAARLGCTPAQVALAWALDASPNVLVIPGTSSLHHLRENLAASAVHLDAEALHQLSEAGATR